MCVCVCSFERQYHPLTSVCTTAVNDDFSEYLPARRLKAPPALDRAIIACPSCHTYTRPVPDTPFFNSPRDTSSALPVQHLPRPRYRLFRQGVCPTPIGINPIRRRATLLVDASCQIRRGEILSVRPHPVYVLGAGAGEEGHCDHVTRWALGFEAYPGRGLPLRRVDGIHLHRYHGGEGYVCVCARARTHARAHTHTCVL
jgi:hypothetical protein